VSSETGMSMAWRRLADRLPAYYRREGGASLESWLEPAEELSAELRRAVGSADERVAAALARLLPRAGAEERRGSWPAAGTAAAVAAWFGAEGPPPRIWSGLSLEETEGGRLLVVQGLRRAAVLAWMREAPPSALRPPPPGLLPAGMLVQAVVLARELRPTPPVPGACLEGRIIWGEGAEAVRAPADRVASPEGDP
jgi:hypothetical protein